jgi:hypothetical protein
MKSGCGLEQPGAERQQRPGQQVGDGCDWTLSCSSLMGDALSCTERLS